MTRLSTMVVFATVAACVPSKDERAPRVLWEGGRASDLEAEVDFAIELVAAFARKHSLATPKQRKTLHIEVFNDRAALWRRYTELAKSPGLPPPERAPSGLNFGDDTLLVLSPTEFAKVPVGRSTDHAWARLVAHELTHFFHRDLVGAFNIDLTPKWFIEGVAVIASGQEFGVSVGARSPREALELADANGETAYASYGAAVRYFASKTSLSELAAFASEQGFNNWLLALY